MLVTEYGKSCTYPTCPGTEQQLPIQLHDRLELGAAGWRCHVQHGSTAIPRPLLRLNLGHKGALVLVERRVAGFASVEDPQHIDYEQNQQYGAQPYACTPAITPAAMAVVPSTAP
jgi:hypothetical protein